MKTKTCLIGIMLFCSIGTVQAEVVFGRLYTTAGQRAQLDEARNKLPMDGIKIDIVEQELLPTEAVEVQTDSSQSISLDGIVYRTDGKNTAWINRNNTNQGNLENQFTRVDENDVRSNQVRITLPDNHTRIDLKVGQRYDVTSKKVNDLAEDPQTATPSRLPEDHRPSR